MSNSPHHFKKAVKKAVRKAQSEEEIQHDAKAGIDKKTYDRYVTTEEEVAKKSAKLKGRRDKMANTVETGWDTEPQHIHHDTEYREKHIQQKIVDQAKRFGKKLMKNTKDFFKKWK